MSSLVKSIKAGRVTMTAAALFASVAMSPVAFGSFTPFYDGFDTLDSELHANLYLPLDATWAAFRNTDDAPAPSATAVDGNLVLNTGSTVSGRRAVIATTRSDFNFFAQPLTFDLKIADLAGTPHASPNPGGPGFDNIYNSYYMAVGQGTMPNTTNEPTGRLQPVNDANNFGDGVWVRLSQGAGDTAADAATKWWLEISSVADSSGTVLRRELTAEPNQLTLTLDGTGSDIAYSVTLGGADFATHGGGDTLSGNFTNLTEAHFTSGTNSDHGKFRLALGANNRGNSVHESTVGYFDSISVVPEPTGVAALAVGSLFLARRRRP